jgi:metallo-beta-lactamase family protein
MCDAGRVRKHLKRLLWRKETTVLLCGFQAGGTLGRLLADGASRVTIQGDEIRVRARVRRLDVYSAHADGPALARWVAARAPVSGSVFLVHGEPEGAEGLSRRLVEAGLSPEKIRIPDLDEGFDLSPADAIAVEGARARLAPHSASRPDWHNDRAAFQIALGAALEAAPDDEARKALLARLDRALEGA